MQPFKPSTYTHDHIVRLKETIEEFPPSDPRIPRIEQTIRGMGASLLATNINNALVQIVRDEKKRRALTVREMAAMVACSPASVSNDLSGRGDIGRLLNYLHQWDLRFEISIYQDASVYIVANGHSVSAGLGESARP